MKKKLESYKLDPNMSMYDMCYCAANCKTPCARAKSPCGIITMSDFTNHCADFDPKDEK